MINLKNILVATDFGEAATAAYAYGRALAKQFDATLHVIHVAENVVARALGGEAYVTFLPDLQREVEESARQELTALVMNNDPPATALRVKPVVLVSNAPAIEIVNYAKHHHIDLIVLGTHGREGVARFFMGSVAERVVRTADCPVLTIRHPERAFVLPDTLVEAQRSPEAQDKGTAAPQNHGEPSSS